MSSSPLSFLTSHVDFLVRGSHTWEEASTLFWPWLVHFVFSWVGFTTYMVWDYAAYRRGDLAKVKLITRHPVDVTPEEDWAGKPAHNPDPERRAPPLFGLFRVSPFWYAQLFMVPLVLFNQLVVWPLVSLLVVWPQWARRHRTVEEWVAGVGGGLGAAAAGGGVGAAAAAAAAANATASPSSCGGGGGGSLADLMGAGGAGEALCSSPSSSSSPFPSAEALLGLLPSSLPGALALAATTVVLFLVSDFMWYWSHRLMHVPWCWKNLHRMHHIAPQCAISATFVHPWEYTLWVIAMQLPWAVAGYPLAIFLVPLGWGMMTGSGAHSGYGDTFANGAQHNAHHYYHSVNFSLLMIADKVVGTHWVPGQPVPGHNPLMADVEAEFAKVYQVEGGNGTRQEEERKAKARGAKGAEAGRRAKAE
jgi:sterol desaturase/sphingolipid hydroxylase (fatty acid hydroxylase superfamily)